MRPFAAASLVALMLVVAGASASAQDARPSLRVASGVGDDGTATSAWRAILARRIGDTAAARHSSIRRPLAAHERAWAARVTARLPAWEREIAKVAAPFSPIPAPAVVTIVLGNRGASDAFTHDSATIGFDLAALQQAYGDADDEGNAERLDRFFRHEYTHVMQKRWWSAHPYAGDTPLRAALAEMWAEGLGNRHSLSARWRAAGGAPSATAERARAELEPRLVARLAALACATPAQAARLTADLSWGRFDRKWGALVPALWLAAEPAPDSAYRALVVAGPEGIWTLAARHLPPPLGAALREVQTADSLCRVAGGEGPG